MADIKKNKDPDNQNFTAGLEDFIAGLQVRM